MKIYTKSGDKGETSLLGGKRVKKASPFIPKMGGDESLRIYLNVFTFAGDTKV